MKIFLLFATVLFFSACGPDFAAVGPEDISPKVPKGLEIVDEKTVRDELTPSKQEDIVDEDYKASIK